MRQQTLRARPRRRRLPSDTGERQAGAVAPNALNRQFVQMARTLEAGITEAANGGEDGALGIVVDRIFEQHQW